MAVMCVSLPAASGKIDCNFPFVAIIERDMQLFRMQRMVFIDSKIFQAFTKYNIRRLTNKMNNVQDYKRIEHAYLPRPQCGKLLSTSLHAQTIFKPKKHTA